MTSKVIYQGDLRTIATHIKSKQEVLFDAPVDNEGKGEAFSPTDMLATSLGVCMLTIIGIEAKKKNFSINGAYGEITKIMAENPRRVSEIIIDFYFQNNNYTEKEKILIRNCIDTCPVAKSIHPDIRQSIRTHY